MIRYICRGAVPHDRLRRFCYPSIDRLLKLSNCKDSKNSCDLTERSQAFSAILRHIRIGSTWKLTKSRRLLKTDRLLTDHLMDEHYSSLKFLDVGGSDGITTLETVNHLESVLGIPVTAYLSDRFLWLLRMKYGCFIEYITARGEPLMVRCGKVGLLLNSAEEDAGFITKWLASRYLALTRFRSLMRLTEKIPLVNPTVLASNKIKLLEMNIFHINPAFLNSMDLIRASNVLNLSYFTETQIAHAIGIMHSYLKINGHLLISRNSSEKSNEIECGSIWRKQEKAFVHLTDFNGGSEVRSIVEQYRHSPST